MQASTYGKISYEMYSPRACLLSGMRARGQPTSPDLWPSLGFRLQATIARSLASHHQFRISLPDIIRSGIIPAAGPISLTRLANQSEAFFLKCCDPLRQLLEVSSVAKPRCTSPRTTASSSPTDWSRSNCVRMFHSSILNRLPNANAKKLPPPTVGRLGRFHYTQNTVLL
jgi:hypothetical protein